MNPFASCLPMVAQLPVFLVAVLHAAPVTSATTSARRSTRPARPTPCPVASAATSQFLFIPDLTNRLTSGWVLVVLIVLYVGTQLASTLLMSTTTDRTQRMIFLALPFFFVAVRVGSSRPACSCTGSPRTCGRSCSRGSSCKRLGPMRPPGAGAGVPSGDMIRKASGTAATTTRATARDRRCLEDPEDGAGAVRSPGASPRAGPARAAARAAAPQEETLREETMSESGQRPEDPVDRVREVLETVGNSRSGSTPRVHVEQTEEGIRGVLEGDDLGLFIGRHGQTIDAVQHLAFKVANRDGGRSGVRVVVDAAGYRARREQALQRQADEAVLDAVRGRRPVALDAMSATERKVVHEYLKDRDDVETYSEGTEP